MTSLPARIALALAAAVVALLCVLGVRSLVLGDDASGDDGVGRADPGRLLRTDAEQLAGAGLTEGYYRAHRDPRVLLALKPGDGWETHGVEFRGTDLGLRARPDGEPPEGAVRVVVAGDSVAFGYGVRDDETLAAQLERQLAAARPADAPPVACLTAAAPGWNHRNAAAFVEDHWAELRPDIVVFVAVSNDLADGYAVTETGHRRAALDISQHDPWLRVDIESGLALRWTVRERFMAGELQGSLRDVPWGPLALIADLTAESRRRYDDNAASFARLAELCAGSGAHFALVPLEEQNLLAEYAWILAERVAALQPPLHVIRGFGATPAALRLENNPHPNAVGHGVLAGWVARELLERGALEGDATALPALPDVAEDCRAPERSADELRRRARDVRDAAREALAPAIDPHTGSGIQQVYGGLNLDGSMGARLLAMLPGDGQQLVLRAAGVAGTEHLGAVELAVEVDGAPLGRLRVPCDPSAGPVSAVLWLPVGRDPAQPVEVRLSPDRWAVTDVRGRREVTSCRLISLEVR